MSSHMKKLAKKQAGGSSKSKVERAESDIMKGKRAPLQIKIALKKANAGMTVKSSTSKVAPKPTVDSAKPKVYTPKTYVDKYGRTMKGVPPKPTTFKKGGAKKK